MKSSLDIKGLSTYLDTYVGSSDLTAGADAWVDWDISALVPTNTRVVEVMVYNSVGASTGVRYNGSADDRKYVLTSWLSLLVKVNAGIIERWHPAGADHAYYIIVGYFT